MSLWISRASRLWFLGSIWELSPTLVQLQIWKLCENTISFYKQKDYQGDVCLKMWYWLWNIWRVLMRKAFRMHLASSQCGSDHIESGDISWISSTCWRVLVVYLAVRILFSLLSSKCRFSSGLNGSLLLFENNPAWEKPACKHEKVAKCANWFLRKKAQAVKLFTRGISPGSVSV